MQQCADACPLQQRVPPNWSHGWSHLACLAILRSFWKRASPFNQLNLPISVQACMLRKSRRHRLISDWAETKTRSGTQRMCSVGRASNNRLTSTSCSCTTGVNGGNSCGVLRARPAGVTCAKPMNPLHTLATHQNARKTAIYDAARQRGSVNAHGKAGQGWSDAPAMVTGGTGFNKTTRKRGFQKASMGKLRVAHSSRCREGVLE